MKRNLQLKIFSYNIHKGFGWGLRKYTLNSMRGEIRRRCPDLIFLQEVHGLHTRHQKRIGDWPVGSQFEYLAEELWPHFTYGKNATYSSGHHGNAILSRFPITSRENIDISENRFEKRGLLHAKIQVSSDREPVHAFCVHLGLLEKDRKKQIHQIIDHIRSTVPDNAPIIMAGDFNDWQRKGSGLLMKQLKFQEAFLTVHGDYPKTFPSFYPLIQLDRIYFRNMSAAKARCLKTEPWVFLSDHLPLEAEFTFGL